MQKVTNGGRCVFSPFFEEEAIQRSCHSLLLRRKGIRKNGGVREEVMIIHRDAPQLKKGRKAENNNNIPPGATTDGFIQSFFIKKF